MVWIRSLAHSVVSVYGPCKGFVSQVLGTLTFSLHILKRRGQIYQMFHNAWKHA